MAISGFHKDNVGLDNHVPHTYTYADEAARSAAVSANFDDPEDLFKLARQTSDQTYWVLEAITPSVVWNQLGGGSGAAELPFTTAIDPAVDAAVTTAIVDINSGIVITLTAAGNSQTLQAPTDTTAGRKFFVLNNDTSTNGITVNGTLLGAAQYGEWRWDGTAWLFTAGGAAGGPGGLDSQIQYNNAGVLAGDANHTWDDVGKRETVVGDIEQVGGTTALLYTPTQVSATAVGTNPRFSIVQANYLYVCDANDNTLRIYDVTDPAAPALVSTLVIGGGRGVDVAGRYVYYTDEDNGGRLVIVDVIDKSTPVVVGSVVTGGSPRGVKVRGTIAIVTYNASTDTVRVLDVSDPTAPVQIGATDASSAGRTDLDIRGNVVAVPAGVNVTLYDFTDPENILLLATIGGESFSCKFQGRYLYTTDNTADEFLIFDTANPDVPVKVGTLALTVPSSVRSISVSGDFAYIVDASNDEMRVIDISDPTAPVFISTAVSVGLNPIAITTVGRYAYVLDNNGDQFLVMDVGGIDAQNLNVGNVDAGNMNLRRDLKMGGVLSAEAGTFGVGGLNSDGPAAAQGRLLGGKPFNIVEIYRETDFPIVGGDIVLATGTVYVLMAPISTDKQILHPVSGGAFSPAKIASSNKELNTLTSTGTGGAFLRTQGGQGQLVLQNLTITNTGSRVFADVSGLTQTDLLTELDDTALFDFDDGTVFDTCIFNANNNAFWTGSGTFTLVDCECNFADMFHANFTDLNLGGNALAGSNIERWSLTNTTTGELTYNGIEPFSGTIFAQLSTLGETGSPEYRFRAVKNGAVLVDGIETVREAGAVQIVTTGLVASVSVVTGDTIRLQVNNIDDASDITISHLAVSIQ